MIARRLERAKKNYSTQGHQEEGQNYEQKRRASRLVCMLREKSLGNNMRGEQVQKKGGIRACVGREKRKKSIQASRVVQAAYCRS